MTTPITLFVYGTLKQGYGRNRFLVDNGSTFIGTTSTAPAYILYQVPDADYPCIVPARDGISIEGELWEISEETLEILDQVEGVPDLYQREFIALNDGRKVVGYLMNRVPPGAKKLGSSWKG